MGRHEQRYIRGYIVASIAFPKYMLKNLLYALLQAASSEQTLCTSMRIIRSPPSLTISTTLKASLKSRDIPLHLNRTTIVILPVSLRFFLHSSIITTLLLPLLALRRRRIPTPLEQTMPKSILHLPRQYPRRHMLAPPLHHERRLIPRRAQLPPQRSVERDIRRGDAVIQVGGEEGFGGRALGGPVGEGCYEFPRCSGEACPVELLNTAGNLLLAPCMCA